MQKQKYQAYAAATQTVARTKQIVMLYDGAIRFMQQAKEAIRAKRIEDRYHALTKASNVISGLQVCLDFEKGGNIARILHNFYSMIDSSIFSIHRNNSLETCDEVINELKKMRDVWQDIDTESEKTDAVATPSAPISAPASASATSPDAEKTIILSA